MTSLEFRLDALLSPDPTKTAPAANVIHLLSKQLAATFAQF